MNGAVTLLLTEEKHVASFLRKRSINIEVDKKVRVLQCSRANQIGLNNFHRVMKGRHNIIIKRWKSDGSFHLSEKNHIANFSVEINGLLAF